MSPLLTEVQVKVVPPTVRYSFHICPPYGAFLVVEYRYVAGH